MSPPIRARRLEAARNCVAVVSLLLILLPAPAEAKIAVFEDGRILKVEDAYLDDDQIVLDLRGGGRMVVPAIRIQRIVSDEVEESSEFPDEQGACSWVWTDHALPKWLPYRVAIQDAAQTAGVHARLLAALVEVESGFDPKAVSRAGAKGLTQLMPSAAIDHGVTEIFDPADNLRGGASHLRAQLDRFQSLTLALAAYNAGATTVERYHGVPPYRETRGYVRRILEAFCETDNPESFSH